MLQNHEKNEIFCAISRFSFLNPREIYNQIVVIDPSCGGLDRGSVKNGVVEKELTLQIAGKLKEKLDESRIKAYYTRMDDVNPAAEQRVSLANEVKAVKPRKVNLTVEAEGSRRMLRR